MTLTPADVLEAIRADALGLALDLNAPEGPRPGGGGQCAYCAGPCVGVTSGCQLRVWQEAWGLRPRLGRGEP